MGLDHLGVGSNQSSILILPSVFSKLKYAFRYELAKLCGYKTFSHRALSYSLVESPENLAVFHEVLGKGLPSRVKQV